MPNTFSKSAVVLSVVAAATAVGNPPPRRLSSKVVDLGRVHPIHMTAGMATLIEFPGAVTGIRLGNPDDVQYFRPESPENEVTLVLKNGAAQPTNLIVRSGKRKYVFDIIPSKSVHQDTVEVVGAYGGPGFDTANAKLIDSSGNEGSRK
jgi:hypothetical protein